MEWTDGYSEKWLSSKSRNVRCASSIISSLKQRFSLLLQMIYAGNNFISFSNVSLFLLCLLRLFLFGNNINIILIPIKMMVINIAGDCLASVIILVNFAGVIQFQVWHLMKTQLMLVIIF